MKAIPCLWNLLVFVFFLTSCTTTSTEHRAQSQSELIIQEIHADLGDVKHQIHNLGVDLRILEEKIKEQERDVTGIQKKVTEGQKFQKSHLQGGLTKLEKKVFNLQSQRDNVVSDIHQLKRIVNDLGTSIGQYKVKLQESERVFTTNQQQSEKNIAHLKNALESLMTLVKQKGGSSTTVLGNMYTVRSGDSLERIARKHRTTVERLKEVNQLTSDLIIVGDELQLPE